MMFTVMFGSYALQYTEAKGNCTHSSQSKSKQNKLKKGMKGGKSKVNSTDGARKLV